MSHELRTPLNAIIGFSEMMHAADVRPARHRTNMSNMRATSTRAAHYPARRDQRHPRHVEDRGRPDRARHRDARSRRRSSPRALRVGRSRPRRKAITSSADVGDPASICRPTAARCKQVLINLLSNAVKFTPGRRARHACAAAKRGAQRSIVIADTGIGIPRDDLAKLGRPFEQVENQFTKSQKGIGPRPRHLALARRAAWRAARDQEPARRRHDGDVHSARDPGGARPRQRGRLTAPVASSTSRNSGL